MSQKTFVGTCLSTGREVLPKVFQAGRNKVSLYALGPATLVNRLRSGETYEVSYEEKNVIDNGKVVDPDNLHIRIGFVSEL